MGNRDHNQRCDIIKSVRYMPGVRAQSYAFDFFILKRFNSDKKYLHTRF